jgi:hypothetical protein
MKKPALLLPKNNLSLILRLLFCLSCLAGIVITLAWNENLLSGLSYFTIQSNILCLAVMVFVIGKQLRGKPTDARTLAWFKGGATIAILVTFLVFHFIIRPFLTGPDFSEYPFGVGSILCHYVTPLWFLADYLAFDKKGSYKILDPLGWVLIPTAYYLYVTVYSALGGRFDAGENLSRYPYFFLNPEIMGRWGVVLAVIIILTGMTLLSYGLIALDRILYRKTIKTPPKAV